MHKQVEDKWVRKLSTIKGLRDIEAIHPDFFRFTANGDDWGMVFNFHDPNAFDNVDINALGDYVIESPCEGEESCVKGVNVSIVDALTGFIEVFDTDAFKAKVVGLGEELKEIESRSEWDRVAWSSVVGKMELLLCEYLREIVSKYSTAEHRITHYYNQSRNSNIHSIFLERVSGEILCEYYYDAGGWAVLEFESLKVGVVEIYDHVNGEQLQVHDCNTVNDVLEVMWSLRMNDKGK